MNKNQTSTISFFVFFGCVVLIFYIYIAIGNPAKYRSVISLDFTFLILFLSSYTFYLIKKDITSFLHLAIAVSFIPSFGIFLQPIIGPLDLSWVMAFIAIVYMVLPISEANTFMIPFFLLILIAFLTGCIGIWKLPLPTKEYLPFFLSIALIIGICNSTLKKLTKYLIFYKQAALIDPLTGLPNRRGLIEEATKVFAFCKRHNFPLSALFIDIDNFKKINDTYGHAFGDTILKKLGALISSSIRKSDIVGRYGGEEFVVLLPKTDLKGASKVADNLRTIVTRHFENSLGIRVTISVGIASLENADNLNDLINKSDKAMYKAKRAGKDRTAFYSGEE